MKPNEDASNPAGDCRVQSPAPTSPAESGRAERKLLASLGCAVVFLLALTWWLDGAARIDTVSSVRDEAATTDDPRAPELDSVSESTTRTDVGPRPTLETASVRAEAERERWSVTTRFVDGDGLPVEGVEIAWVPAPGDRDADRARSDPNGHAVLSAPRGAHADPMPTRTLAATRIGFADSRRSVTPDGSAAVELGDWTLIAVGRVDGWVRTGDGVGIAEARVACWNTAETSVDLNPRTLAEAVTTSDGRFSIELPAGIRHLTASHGDWTSEVSGPLVVEAGGILSGIVLTLVARADPRAIDGLVLEPNGAPAAGARVRIVTKGGTEWLRADDFGGFHAEIGRRATAEVLALDPRGRFGEAQARDVPAGTAGLLLRLTELVHVELCARDSDGAALTNYAVHVKDETGEVELSRDAERDRPEGCTSLAIPNQVFVLEVFAENCGPARLGPLDPTRLPARLECTLARGVGLHGTVRVGDGVAAGAQVSLHAAFDPPGSRFDFLVRSQAEANWTTRADAQGRYFLPIAESGRFHVRAEAPGFAPADIGPLECIRDRALEQDLRLEQGGAIEVFLRSTTGARVAGRIVAVSRGDGFIETRRVDAEGRATFAGLTPGRWEARGLADELPTDQAITYFPESTPDEIPWNCTVRSGATTRVDLWLEGAPSPFEIAGTLLLGGEPAVGWSATWRDEESGAGARTDAAGRFLLTSSNGGRRELRLVSPPGIACAPMLVSSTVALDRARTDWRLALDTGVLRGTIERGPPDTMVLHRLKIEGSVVVAPLVEASETSFERCVAAGVGEIIRVRATHALEEQEPDLLRNVEVPRGGRIEIELR